VKHIQEAGPPYPPRENATRRKLLGFADRVLVIGRIKIKIVEEGYFTSQEESQQLALSCKTPLHPHPAHNSQSGAVYFHCKPALADRPEFFWGGGEGEDL